MSPEAQSQFESSLDWSDPDTIDPAEAKALLSWYEETHGEGSTDLTPFVPFLIEHTPGGFKRYRRYVELLGSAEENFPQPAVALLFLYYYMYVGNPKGVHYEVIAAKEWGVTKDEVVSTIELSFLHSGPRGVNIVADEAGDYIRAWDDDGHTSSYWPADWTTGHVPVPDAGLDYGRNDLTEGERTELTTWYTRENGAVPSHVQLLMDYHPAAMKGLQGRREHTARVSALPAQMVPLFSLHTGAALGRPEDVAQAAREARRLGVPRSIVVEVVCWAYLYTSNAMMDVVADALRPILDAWD